MKLNGIITPIITIMTDKGEIDYKNMKLHINNLIENGINGLLFLGSIGEFYSFNKEKKKELIDFAVKEVDGRVPVLVGVGDTNLNDVMDMSTYCKNKGVDVLVLISPYYFAPTEDSTFDYMSYVAKNVDLPLLLYNFPARSGNDLVPDLVYKLAKENKNIIGIKDTVDNISHTRKLINKVKKDFPEFLIFSGFDEYYLSNRVSGGDGLISGLTNVEPKIFSELHRAYQEKDFDTLTDYGNRISKLMEIYDIADLFITGIKAGVKINGLDISTYTNSPSKPITQKQFEEIKNIINDSSV
ncbi:dihydrodipicolinate synthase family protein [Mammaliicoccus lentus]|uniref:Putative dihydrodipicolinate synthase n=1 Tax=Mammaliicoccus lentus TaxID=42858 RepID=I7I7M3_MAMLE|nr:dihydrodipicolinate synthase family protein [Mammaliicoccus lentus]MBW0770836.1 dihydrodipicolinate synthase family protein [Mammaliicoccus lentus]MEB5685986.1 dihydrodipicolinate synthase family protein [Mammaliicoccus lentus]CCF55074.1 putative dihydrodipicolinate synthase [Mammaliicoccus lentus]